MRKTFNKTIEAYLTYLGTVLPDIAQQTRVGTSKDVFADVYIFHIFLRFLPSSASFSSEFSWTWKTVRVSKTSELLSTATPNLITSSSRR